MLATNTEDRMFNCLGIHMDDNNLIISVTCLILQFF